MDIQLQRTPHRANDLFDRRARFGAMAQLNYRLPKARGWDIFAFVDGGRAYRKRPSGGLPNDQWLASAGAGTRFNVLGMACSGELSFPLHRVGSKRHVRAFFSLARVF